MSNSKVYQAQYWCVYDNTWKPLSTKSGGTFCNTLGGAKAKLTRYASYEGRVVSYELSNMAIEER